MKRNLVQFSQYTWDRTRGRLEGLSDHEYFWEPVAGSWSVRRGPAGLCYADGGTAVEPAPVTTIAWRLAHLTTCYGERRNRQWLGVGGEETGSFEATAPVGGSAEDAIDRLEAAHSEWSTVLESVPEESLHLPLGPGAGPYADADREGFILHMLDEFVHHGAEVALLRDLWRAREG